jgi:hypothetical protein
MDEKSGRDETSTETASLEIGRRDTLRLATLAAALGAGLSVTFHTEGASAEGAQQLQLKFYRQQQKGEPLLVYAATLPEEASKKLLEAPGLVQWKCYAKESLLGTSQMQLKLEQAKQAAPAPAPTAAPTPPAAPAPHWDVKANKKL